MTKVAQHLQLWTITAFLAVGDRLTAAPDPDEDRDRGDVPGWVMITVMTAILVIGLLTVFRDQVKAAVVGAFKRVNDAS